MKILHPAVFYAALILGLVVTGCFTSSDKVDPTVDLTAFGIAPDSIFAGETGVVSGSITTNAALTSITYSIWKDGVDFTTGHGFEVLGDTLGTGKKSWDLKDSGSVKLVVSDSVDSGAYTFNVKVAAGKAVDSATANFTVMRNPLSFINDNQFTVTVDGVVKAGSLIAAPDSGIMVLAGVFTTSSASIQACELLFSNATVPGELDLAWSESASLASAPNVIFFPNVASSTTLYLAIGASAGTSGNARITVTAFSDSVIAGRFSGTLRSSDDSTKTVTLTDGAFRYKKAP